MFDLRIELRANHFNCSSQELNEILLKEGSSVGIIVGFLIKGTPHLVTINLYQTIAHLSKQTYETDGSGEALGKYLLSELVTPAMDLKMSSLIASHIVHSVTEHDLYCGTPVKVSAIKPSFRIRRNGDWEPSPRVINFTRSRIDLFAKIGRETERATKAERMRLFHEHFNREAEETYKAMAQMMAEVPMITENPGDHPNDPMMEAASALAKRFSDPKPRK